MKRRQNAGNRGRDHDEHEHVEQRFGIDAVRRLLMVGSEEALLTSLSTDATTLLRDWRPWVMAQS